MFGVLQASEAMSSLTDIAPQKAVLAESREVVDSDEVKVNTIIAVKAGEVIAIDGIVVEGSCEVDEKSLTGESYPVHKQKDSHVWAGTINLNGNSLSLTPFWSLLGKSFHFRHNILNFKKLYEKSIQFS